MYPFPAAADLKFLVGQEIGQIALDPYSLQLRFVDDGHILIVWRAEHVDEVGNSHLHECDRLTENAINLHQLLQRQIMVVDVEPYRLTLKFEGGAILHIFSQEGYECGTISSTKEGFFVF